MRRWTLCSNGRARSGWSLSSQVAFVPGTPIQSWRLHAIDCQDAWLRSDTGGRLADSEAARHVVPILKGMQLLAIDGESVASMLQREQAKCPDLIRADPLTATLEACRARLGDCDTTSGASGTDPSPLVWHRPRIVVRFFPVSQYLLKCVPGARPVEFALCT